MSGTPICGEPAGPEKALAQRDRHVASAGLALDSLPPVLTVPEAASFLRIGRSAAYELVRLGTIPSVRLGHSIRIPRDLLLNWLHNENAAGHEPAPADPWAVPLSTPLAPSAPSAPSISPASSAHLRGIPARPSSLPSNRPERRHER